MMEKVFVDTNVILDLLLERDPFYIEAAKLFSMAEDNKIQIYVSALSFSTVYYFLCKHTNNEGAKTTLKAFKALVTTSSVSNLSIEMALINPMSDFEDAIQLVNAIESKCKTLVTRDIKGFKNSELNIISPSEYLLNRQSITR